MPKFDIIGDIHGCFAEFHQLTVALGYIWEQNIPLHPDNRTLVFLGDITDRGPQSLKMLQTVVALVKMNKALYTPGNHCDKLYRYFKGNKVKINNGLETTVAELEKLPAIEREQIRHSFMEMFEQAPLYLQLDNKKLVVAHAGINEQLLGKQGEKARTFVLYGDITGEKNPDGTPVRRDWAQHYAGEAIIVYGHTPVKEPRIIRNTYNIDTGCVFGGKLTALQYPELRLVSAPSTLPYQEEKFRTFAEH